MLCPPAPAHTHKTAGGAPRRQRRLPAPRVCRGAAPLRAQPGGRQVCRGCQRPRPGRGGAQQGGGAAQHGRCAPGNAGVCVSVFHESGNVGPVCTALPTSKARLTLLCVPAPPTQPACRSGALRSGAATRRCSCPRPRCRMQQTRRCCGAPRPTSAATSTRCVRGGRRAGRV